jgi:hypothetical protein
MNSLTGDAIQEVTFSTSPMSDAHVIFQQQPAPILDNWIAVWVYGDYFGEVEDRLVAEQFIGTEREFQSSAYLKPGVHPLVQKCCDCHNGTKSCGAAGFTPVASDAERVRSTVRRRSAVPARYSTRLATEPDEDRASG